MGVDFAAEGLLDGLDGDERAARLELLERLRSEGATLDELRFAVADGLLVFLLAERLIDGPPRHTSRDVAREAGLPLAKLEAMRRAHGLPVPEPDAIALTDLDVEAIRTAGAFRAAGVTDEQMLRAIRVFGRGMAQAAETLRAIGLELALEPGSSEAELAQRFAERSAAVAALLGPLLDCALELHDTAADESDEFPALRVGVAHGPAVARAGDWYGRPVNLASRITAIARPGSVLATREVRDAAPEGYRWSAAGRRSLRGIDGQVALYRARRADGESAGYS